MEKNVNYSLNIQIFLLNVCAATRKARALQTASAYRRQEFCENIKYLFAPLIGYMKIYEIYILVFQ